MELFPLFVAVPLGVAFLAALVPKRAARVADVLGNLGSLALVALVVLFYGRTGAVHVGGWAPPVGIVLVLDPLSWFILATVSAVTLAVTIYSIRYMDRYTGRGKYYALFFLMVTGMMGVVATGDLFNLYVFLEIASIASYALVAFGCESEELEASFRYAVLGSVASCFILFGIALLYSVFGTVNMAHLAAKIAALGGVTGSTTLTAGLVFFLAGFGLKAALVPFHAWLPDAHPSAPAPISAMLSGVLIKAIGVYALARIVFNVIGLTTTTSYVLMAMGTLSMLFGVLLAVIQWDFKRLLAYHSISQIGYVVLAIGLGTPLGIMGGLFHLLNHALFKSLLFLNAGAVEYSTGTRDLQKMGGLRNRLPVTANTSMVASMSIAGIPPFNGFFSKLIIIVACIEAHQWLFAALAVVVSIVTLASFIKVQKYVFMGSLGEKWKSLREVPVFMCAAMVLLALACLATAALVVPPVRDAVLRPAADVLAAGAEKVGMVLGGVK